MNMLTRRLGRRMARDLARRMGRIALSLQRFALSAYRVGGSARSRRRLGKREVAALLGFVVLMGLASTASAQEWQLCPITAPNPEADTGYPVEECMFWDWINLPPDPGQPSPPPAPDTSHGGDKGKGLARQGASLRFRPNPNGSRPIDRATAARQHVGDVLTVTKDLFQLGIVQRQIDWLFGKNETAQASQTQLGPGSDVGVTGTPTQQIPAGSGAEVSPTNNSDDAKHADPVNPANGDFVVTREDIRLPAKGIDIVFQRVYHSKITFDGPLGHSWSHNFDQRLVPGTDECATELRYHAGQGAVLTFQRGAESDVAVGYQPSSETKTRTRLVGLKTARGLEWRVDEPDGTAKLFDERGLLRRLQGPTGFGLTVAWETADGPAKYRVARVTDDSGRYLQ